jgi:hypothetical protein
VVGSTEWRLVIWEYILEHLKEYFIIGQGLTFSSSELSYLQNVDPNSISAAILTKNYHNGPLSMLIVFGIGGAVVLLFLMLYYYKLIKIIRFSNMDSNNKINGLTVFCAYSLTTFITFLVFYGDLTKMLPLIFTQLFILQMLLNQNSKLNIVKLDLK